MSSKKFLKNKKYYQINNIKIDWIIILFLILFLQIIIYQDLFFGIFLGGMIIFVVYLRQSTLKTKVFGILLMIVSLLSSIYNKSQTIKIFDQIDALFQFSLYDSIIDFVKLNQPPKAADFILLTLFNVKQNEGIFFLIF